MKIREELAKQTRGVHEGWDKREGIRAPRLPWASVHTTLFLFHPYSIYNKAEYKLLQSPVIIKIVKYDHYSVLSGLKVLSVRLESRLYLHRVLLHVE